MPFPRAIAATAALPLLLISFAVTAADLAITIDDARNGEGQIRVALFESRAGFPSGPEAPAKSQTVAAEGAPIGLDFVDLNAGTYAVAVYHDENSNGELDKNLFGIPTEGYGFSNDARGFMGPPSFEEATITLEGHDQVITISLVYWVDTGEWDTGPR